MELQFAEAEVVYDKVVESLSGEPQLAQHQAPDDQSSLIIASIISGILSHPGRWAYTSSEHLINKEWDALVEIMQDWRYREFKFGDQSWTIWESDESVSFLLGSHIYVVSYDSGLNGRQMHQVFDILVRE